MIIKKLNTVFHKHSKVLFGAITLIIIISFVGFTSGGGMFGCDSYGSGSQAVGEVYGKKVSYEELQKFYARISVFRRDNMGIRDIFNLYCMDVRADQIGIHVSDDEVVSFIRELPYCQKNGKFDEGKYQEFLDSLKKQGVSGDALTEAIRCQIKQQKLHDYVLAQVEVTPSEVERLCREDKIVLHFRKASFEFKGTPAPKELKEFFEKNKENYRCVKIAEFPVGKERAAAEKASREFYREVGQKAERFDEVAKLKTAANKNIKIRKEEWRAYNDSDPMDVAIFNADVKKPVAVVAGPKAVYVCCWVRKNDDEKFAAIKKQLTAQWRAFKSAEQAKKAADDLNRIEDRAAREKAFGALKNAKLSDVKMSGNKDIRQGDVVAYGSDVFLLKKREMPDVKMSEIERRVYGQVCRALKGEVVWMSFLEELGTHCKFLLPQEGGR